MAICNKCGKNYTTSSPFGLFNSIFCQSCKDKIKSDRKAKKDDKKNKKFIKSSIESNEEFKVDIDKLRKSFSNKWKNFECNCCKQNDWNVEDKIYKLRAFKGDTIKKFLSSLLFLSLVVTVEIQFLSMQ